MNKFILLSFLCVLAIFADAQEKADIMVSYTVHHPNMRNGKDDMTNRYLLLANADKSKFYSPISEYIDSLNSTPDGKAKYQEMMYNAYHEGDIKDLPRKDGSYYIVKFHSAGKILYYDNVGTDSYYYEESPLEWNWEVGDSTKNVLGYECIRAQTVFNGRKWTVWFTPEIPLSSGPWKFSGLPGFILEAEAEGGHYKFEATGIQQTQKLIQPIYLANEYEKTNRIEFLKAKRKFIDNPLGNIEAQIGSGLSFEDGDGNPIAKNFRMFVPRDEMDFIETDY